MFTMPLNRQTNPRGARLRSYRPSLDGLESRMVLSAVAASPQAHVAAAVTPQVQGSVALPIHVTGINLTNAVQDATSGVVTATGNLTGTLLGHQFTTPVTATVTPGATATATPILNLNLNPIHLNLLGLKVDTSRIDLKVTAMPGGGLLGDLLGSNGLEGQIANQTNSTQLLSTLNSVLNSTTGGLASSGGAGGLLGGIDAALGSLTGSATIPTGGAAHSPHGVTNLVHLSAGPVDLNLLGLDVHLDNGNNGPVVVNVSAQAGKGNLLGNLLTNVAHLLEAPHSAVSGATNQARALLGLIENL